MTLVTDSLLMVFFFKTLSFFFFFPIFFLLRRKSKWGGGWGPMAPRPPPPASLALHYLKFKILSKNLKRYFFSLGKMEFWFYWKFSTYRRIDGLIYIKYFIFHSSRHLKSKHFKYKFTFDMMKWELNFDKF